MDDEFGLLPDQQGAPPPPRRPVGLILGGLVLVALVMLGAVFWLATTLTDRTVVAAGTPAPAATTSATATPAPTASPTPTASTPATTVPPTTVAPTTVPPVTTAPSPTRPAPTPAPATRPVPGPTLSLPVGRLVRVPSVVGLRVQQAVAVLQADGFRVQVIGGVQDTERDTRRVVAQRPTAGSLLPAGFTVILVTDGT